MYELFWRRSLWIQWYKGVPVKIGHTGKFTSNEIFLDSKLFVRILHEKHSDFHSGAIVCLIEITEYNLIFWFIYVIVYP